MKVSFDRPPMFDLISAKFNIAGLRVLFAWGDTIFNPSRVDPIPGELWEHESAHAWSQQGDPAGWWQKYIDDPDFRLREEIFAHGVEYQTLCKSAANRHERRACLAHVAKRLAAPLYGSLISVKDAKKVLAG